jgi:hypothetical protein
VRSFGEVDDDGVMGSGEGDSAEDGVGVVAKLGQESRYHRGYFETDAAAFAMLPVVEKVVEVQGRHGAVVFDEEAPEEGGEVLEGDVGEVGFAEASEPFEVWQALFEVEVVEVAAGPGAGHLGDTSRNEVDRPRRKRLRVKTRS